MISRFDVGERAPCSLLCIQGGMLDARILRMRDLEAQLEE